MSNKLKATAILLPVSLFLLGCKGAAGSGSHETTMQVNGQPANTTSVPIAKPENPSPAAGDVVRVARWGKERSWPSMTALNVGKLGIVNNCMVIINEVGPPTLPIFPYYNGVWDNAKRTFTYEGQVVRIGETIRVGGGAIQDVNAFFKRVGVKYYLPDCGTNSFWVAP